jgi:hypothetical protein
MLLPPETGEVHVKKNWQMSALPRPAAAGRAHEARGAVEAGSPSGPCRGTETEPLDEVGVEDLARSKEAIGQRAAAGMSLVQSARLNEPDPYAYLKNVRQRLPTHLRGGWVSCCSIGGHGLTAPATDYAARQYERAGTRHPTVTEQHSSQIIGRQSGTDRASSNGHYSRTPPCESTT